MPYVSPRYLEAECGAELPGTILGKGLLNAKKILVITLGYPHPRRGASSVLFYWYLNALRNSKFRVEHLLLVSPSELSAQSEREYLEAISPAPCFGVQIFSLLEAQEAQRLGLNLHTSELPDEILSHVQLFQPDAVVCFDIMAAAHRLMDVSEPYMLLSGYRSPATNAMLRKTTEGVARNSLHMSGQAIDLRVPGTRLTTLRDQAQELKSGGVGYYPSSDFVHIDTGRVRTW